MSIHSEHKFLLQTFWMQSDNLLKSLKFFTSSKPAKHRTKLKGFFEKLSQIPCCYITSHYPYLMCTIQRPLILPSLSHIFQKHKSLQNSPPASNCRCRILLKCLRRQLATIRFHLEIRQFQHTRKKFRNLSDLSNNAIKMFAVGVAPLATLHKPETILCHLKRVRHKFSTNSILQNM